jgi:hypothetical protein
MVWDSGSSGSSGDSGDGKKTLNMANYKLLIVNC